ncbi:MAG TPA: gluconate 2-dehydrogenase subunit 3 family protein [Gemmatimonadales bacterium]|nr:gluconate 2-dehydrogenase subunit 3 family protein [Gemmatimonadales bacterium]
MERRDLLRWLARVAGIYAVRGFAPADLLVFGNAVHRGAGSVTTEPGHVERTVLIAAERILPGATEANVGGFIDKMLADWHTPEERGRLLAGLSDLDARCRASAGRDFVDCTEPDQVAVLTSLDNEVTALRAGPGSERANQHWFAMLKFLTVYGWCTSETGMRALGLHPAPWRYDGCAPV